ncbi:MAG: hypothetical protein K0S33_263 [Bacteroidetes bacterium]|jgi:hypothetical protein|nr:hypothetical protein [Bacteroidota bacterium]
MSDNEIISHTSKWIKNVVIDLNFCPFAAKALLKKSIHYSVLHKAELQNSLETLIHELQHLDREDTIETTFIIFPDSFSDIEEYFDLVEQANTILEMQGYEGIYQLAEFHPDYCFAKAEPEDPANYTNRSPYPMLHLLREESVEKAVTTYKDAHLIPERNIELARKKGLLYMQALRAACFQ